jgi:L-seryl-tRNA(Ser) seleniumtransferase
MSSPLPAVDLVLRQPAAIEAIGTFGRAMVTDAVRAELAERRVAGEGAEAATVAAAAAERAAAELAPSQRPVFNLTGTVLHTNLGRAPLPREAVEAAAAAMAGATNLEYDLATGKRGERDAHVRRWLTRLTGAEAASVVNNNAGAVLLLLNALANRKEVPVSRGELIEIGGAFRIPDIMARAGCKLVEVGTTNRTHLADYANAIGPSTALLMKVHPSNYAIEGFTSAVPEVELAKLAHDRGLPFVVDLGSGSLIDLAPLGLPHEPTPRETLAAGADLVTFSGDKLLGGPQAGLIVGRAELIRRIDRNPFKRALRMDKGRLAALEAVLRLHADPDRLRERVPTLRLLARPEAEIAALGVRLLAATQTALAATAEIELVACQSQIGSGSLPVDRLPSRALALRPKAAGGRAVERLAARFRALPVPVIGRIADGRLLFDLRCLEDEAGFCGQLGRL